MLTLVSLLLLLVFIDQLLVPIGLKGIFSYADELLIVVYVMYLFYHKRYIGKTDIKVFWLLLIAILIGFLSNISSNLVHNLFPIAVDALWLLKVPVAFIGMKYVAILSPLHKNSLSKYSSFFFSLLLLLAFFAILTLFIDTGMNEGERYGLPSFSFIYGNPGQCGVWSCVFFLLFLQKENKSKHMVRIGEIAMLIIVIFTTKGIPFMAIGTYVMLIILSRKKTHNKLTLKKLLIIIPFLIFMAGYQIDSYLEDLDSPRMVLAFYGIKTAADYAPLGSGFSTYGSEMASRYYSPLYVKYGFENLWGLQDLSQYPELTGVSCLNDIYFLGIFAQLGWIGFLFFICSFIIIFLETNKTCMDIRKKSICIGIIAALYIAGIASGMTKTAMSVFAFSVIGFVVGYQTRSSYIKN